jgi:transposase InsO family protein
LASEGQVSITAVCRQLGYSKQSYYKAVHNRQIKTCYNAIAKQKVLSIRNSMPRLGARKLYYLLKEAFVQEGIRLGRDRLFDVLREERLLIVKKKRYSKTTDSKHWMHKYPNLVKGMDVCRPEQLWVADITYVALKDRFCYLHLITDAYSKKIMGYSLSNDLAASSTVKALYQALGNRTNTKALMHHSDRGLQYCSAPYTKTLLENNLIISMTENGDPYENAIAERVNGILKEEFSLGEKLQNILEAEQLCKQGIHVYNELRPHLSCQMKTPKEMHSQQSVKLKTWNKKSSGTKQIPELL